MGVSRVEAEVVGRVCGWMNGDEGRKKEEEVTEVMHVCDRIGTNLMVGQLDTEDIWDVEDRLVLGVVDGRGGDVCLDTVELLPFTCIISTRSQYSAQIMLSNRGSSTDLREYPRGGRLGQDQRSATSHRPEQRI